MPRRSIAKEPGISRKTVKKPRREKCSVEQAAGERQPKDIMTPDVESFIQSCLDGDAEVREKKRHTTARRIYQRLVEEKGFSSGESTVRRLCRGNSRGPFIGVRTARRKYFGRTAENSRRIYRQ